MEPEKILHAFKPINSSVDGPQLGDSGASSKFEPRNSVSGSIVGPINNKTIASKSTSKRKNPPQHEYSSKSPIKRPKPLKQGVPHTSLWGRT